MGCSPENGTGGRSRQSRLRWRSQARSTIIVSRCRPGGSSSRRRTSPTTIDTSVNASDSYSRFPFAHAFT